jgi:hypothetical protein
VFIASINNAGDKLFTGAGVIVAGDKLLPASLTPAIVSMKQPYRR